MVFEKFGEPKNKYSNRVQKEIKDGMNEFDEDKLEDKKAQEKIDSMKMNLASTEDFYEKNGEQGVELIHDWYSKAISRRDREPLPGENFSNHFFEGGSSDETFMYGNIDKGFLLGYLKHEVFVPTHFAPKNIRGGYDLVKELGSSQELPCVMSITDDLVKTITKMPEWKSYDLSFMSDFRGDDHEKFVVYNEHPKVKQLMMGLLAEYLNDSDDYEDDYDEDGDLDDDKETNNSEDDNDSNDHVYDKPLSKRPSVS